MNSYKTNHVIFDISTNVIYYKKKVKFQRMSQAGRKKLIYFMPVFFLEFSVTSFAFP